jgi:hypothetical protein
LAALDAADNFAGHIGEDRESHRAGLAAATRIAECTLSRRMWTTPVPADPHRFTSPHSIAGATRAGNSTFRKCLSAVGTAR